MKLTVVGKSPAWQDRGGACSSYLISEGDTSVLLDCGNGAFGALRELADPGSVDAIFVSHLHADHFFDLVPYAFSLSSAPKGDRPALLWSVPAERPPISLFSPPGATAAFAAVCGVWNMPSMIPDTFDFSEYDPASEIEVGPLTISFRAVPHYIDTWAISVTGSNGGRLVYGADCAPNGDLIEFSSGADLLIAEATLVEPEPDPDDRGHMTPREAAGHARDAGVPRLLLTHIPDQVDPAWAISEAAEIFDGQVDVASGAMVIDL